MYTVAACSYIHLLMSAWMSHHLCPRCKFCLYILIYSYRLQCEHNLDPTDLFALPFPPILSSCSSHHTACGASRDGLQQSRPPIPPGIRIAADSPRWVVHKKIQKPCSSCKPEHWFCISESPQRDGGGAMRKEHKKRFLMDSLAIRGYHASVCGEHEWRIVVTACSNAKSANVRCRPQTGWESTAQSRRSESDWDVLHFIASLNIQSLLRLSPQCEEAVSRWASSRPSESVFFVLPFLTRWAKRPVNNSWRWRSLTWLNNEQTTWWKSPWDKLFFSSSSLFTFPWL